MLNNFFLKNGIIQLTNKCNNNCIICQDWRLGQGSLMIDYKQLKKEVDFLISKGFKSISIYGAEPYLNKNMGKLLEYISQFNVGCNISTNARVFSSKALVQNLKKIKKIYITTSLFSYKKNEHEHITDTLNSYDQTIAGIKNIIALNIPITVTIVLTTVNVKSLLGTVKFLQKLGVKKIKISGLINQGRIVKRPGLIPSFDDVKNQLSSVIDYIESKEIKLVFEKLPLCAIKESKFEYKYEKQHKKNMLIFPKDLSQCIKCKVKSNCTCFN